MLEVVKKADGLFILPDHHDQVPGDHQDIGHSDKEFYLTPHDALAHHEHSP